MSGVKEKSKLAVEHSKLQANSSVSIDVCTGYYVAAEETQHIP